MALHDSITAVKEGIRDLLESSEFRVHLDEIGSELGHKLAPPEVVYVAERQTAPMAFPSAELIASQSAPQGESSAMIYDHRIDVLWTVNGDTEDTIVAHLESLVLATRRVTYRGIIIMKDGTTAQTQPGNEQYGPLLRGSERTMSPLVKEARIELTVPTLS